MTFTGNGCELERPHELFIIYSVPTPNAVTLLTYTRLLTSVKLTQAPESSSAGEHREDGKAELTGGAAHARLRVGSKGGRDKATASMASPTPCSPETKISPVLLSFGAHTKRVSSDGHGLWFR